MRRCVRRSSAEHTDHVYDGLARVCEGLEALTQLRRSQCARPAASGSTKHWIAGQEQAARLGGEASCWAARCFLSPKCTPRGQAGNELRTIKKKGQASSSRAEHSQLKGNRRALLFPARNPLRPIEKSYGGSSTPMIGCFQRG